MFSSNDAIKIAQAKLQVAADAPVRFWEVRLLDTPGNYYLLVFGAESAAMAVAAVSAKDGRVLSSAVFRRPSPYAFVGRDEAIAIAGFEPATQAELVWRPSRASMSPLYPFWRLSTEHQEAYVTQQRQLLLRLEAGARGGGRD